MEKIKSAVIGCGVIAPSHIEGYRSVEGVDVAWVCDLVRGKADMMAAKYGIPKVTCDFRELLSDPEVSCVSICTDHGSHSMIAVEAFRKGKHVLCEKALASSHKGLEAMFEMHRRHKDLVFSGIFQNRYNKIYQLARRLVSENSFGVLLRADMSVNCLRTDEYYNADEWRGTWAREGGSLMINQAIHFVDILSWIAGGVKYVSGTCSNLTHQDSIETEDTVAAFLRFSNGALGTISATSSSLLGWDQSVYLNGTRGSFELRDGRILRLEMADKNLEESIRAEIRSIEEEAKVSGPGKAYYGPSHSCQIADFIGCIRTGREPFVTAESARHAVDIVLGIYQSHRDRKWIRI